MKRKAANVFGLLMLQTAVSTGTFCKFSSENGVPTFQLFPIPGPHCMPYWSDGEDYQLGSSNKYDKNLVRVIIQGKISLKKCMTTVKCSVECEKDTNLEYYKVECSGNCSVDEIQPALGSTSASNSAHNYSDSSGDNKGSETCEVPCIVSVIAVIVVIVGIGLFILWKSSYMHNRCFPNGQSREIC
ncbi:hypothetical protein AALO_G00179060 [Alosa alosa]|uniref:WSC domain-containing protein n=1 Tax=Alosa alosa TaxID=278164 RepID=A0AAV6GC04_9TELE|nr:hypothetical protein AALO_G00179060 [Alosa alosa]